jgi:hypothetical protein
MDKKTKSDFIFYSTYFLLAILYCVVTIKFIPVSYTTNILIIFIFIASSALYKYINKKKNG